MTTQEQAQTRAAWGNIAPGYNELVTPEHGALAHAGSLT